MEKQRAVRILAICLILGTLVCGVAYLNSAVKVLSICEYSCSLWLGCTPSAFFEQEFDFFKETGDLRKTSYIGKDGSLCIVITQKQIERWREYEQSLVFLKYEGTNIEIGLDYKSLVYHYPMDIMLNASDIEVQEIFNGVNHAIDKLFLIQFLMGLSEDETQVAYSEVDSITGEVLYSEIYRY